MKKDIRNGKGQRAACPVLFRAATVRYGGGVAPKADAAAVP